MPHPGVISPYSDHRFYRYAYRQRIRTLRHWPLAWQQRANGWGFKCNNRLELLYGWPAQGGWTNSKPQTCVQPTWGHQRAKMAGPPKIIGKPPQTVGPLAAVTADIEAQVYWNLGVFFLSWNWDRETTKPSKAKLISLGLDDVAKDLWP